MNCKQEIKQHGNFMVLGTNIFNDGKCFTWGKNDVIEVNSKRKMDQDPAIINEKQGKC